MKFIFCAVDNIKRQERYPSTLSRRSPSLDSLKDEKLFTETFLTKTTKRNPNPRREEIEENLREFSTEFTIFPLSNPPLFFDAILQQPPTTISIIYTYIHTYPSYLNF